MNYFVMWEIDIEADTPAEAACKALEIQRDPTSRATVFKVTSESGHVTSVETEPDGEI